VFSRARSIFWSRVSGSHDAIFGTPAERFMFVFSPPVISTFFVPPCALISRLCGLYIFRRVFFFLRCYRRFFSTSAPPPVSALVARSQNSPPTQTLPHPLYRVGALFVFLFSTVIICLCPAFSTTSPFRAGSSSPPTFLLTSSRSIYFFVSSALPFTRPTPCPAH